MVCWDVTKRQKSNIRGRVDLVRFQRNFEVAIDLEAFATLTSALLIGVDDLGNAPVLLQLRRDALSQIDQKIRSGHRGGIRKKMDGRRRVRRLRIPANPAG